MNAPATATTEDSEDQASAFSPDIVSFQAQEQPPVLTASVDEPVDAEADTPHAPESAAHAAPAHPQASAPAPATGIPQAALDALAAAVLDAAELANRGAHAAAGVSAELHKATDGLRKDQDKAHRQSLILLAAVSTIMVLAVMFFVVTGVRLNSRINQLDATLLAVAKRAVALNEGLESLENVNEAIGKLAEQVEQVAKNTADVGGRADQASKQAESLSAQIAAKTAEQVASGNKGLASQVEGLNARLSAQAGALQSLSRELSALKSGAASVDKLNRDVQSLVTLQRERYLEAMQKAAAAPAAAPAPAPAPVERDRGVQYPRAQPQTSPNAGGVIVVAPPKGN